MNFKRMDILTDEAEQLRREYLESVAEAVESRQRRWDAWWAKSQELFTEQLQLLDGQVTLAAGGPRLTRRR